MPEGRAGRALAGPPDSAEATPLGNPKPTRDSNPAFTSRARPDFSPNLVELVAFVGVGATAGLFSQGAERAA